MATAPSIADLERICQSAQNAARLAGKLIRERAGRIDAVMTKASSMDLVTVVDKECQAIIEQHLVAAHPGMIFLGEESVPAGSEASAKAIAELASIPGYLVRHFLLCLHSSFEEQLLHILLYSSGYCRPD